MKKNYFSKITGVGSCLPKKVVGNADLSFMLNTSNEWIFTRTGIKERRIANKNETTVFLGVEAAKQALEAADCDVKSIDMIIAGTTTSDYIMPSTACGIASELGAVNACAFDVAAACTGFIYGLDIADKYIKLGEVKKVLVVGVDKYSRLCNKNDRTTAILFGDGAGAALVEKSDVPGIEYTEINSDGSYSKILTSKQLERLPEYKDEDDSYYLKMQGKEVFKIAISKFVNMGKNFVKKTGLDLSEIDLFIPHQANKRIIMSFAEKLGIPKKKMFINVDKYGNTSAASIAIALKEAIEEGKVKQNSRVFLCAFGGGITWGCVALKM